MTPVELTQSALIKPYFDCTQVGPNVVTLTVIDVNGNSSACEATVTVEDNVNPNAAAEDVTIYLDAAGVATIQASDINAGSNANCGVDTVFVDQTDFDCSHAGNNTVTLTVVDNNGNVSTCTANVEVLDTINPIPVCQDIIIYVDDNGEDSIDEMISTTDHSTTVQYNQSQSTQMNSIVQLLVTTRLLLR